MICFADSWQLGRTFDVGPKPSESRIHKLSIKYSWAPKFLLDQRLGPFEVDAVRMSHPDFRFRIYKLFNKLLIEFILNVH